MISKVPSILKFQEKKFPLRDHGTEMFLTRRCNPEMSVPEGYKQCTKCGDVKEIKEFHMDNKEKDGHHSNCRECRKR